MLRQEPQFRLLFSGQVLSIIGDRVTMVALPFAVLAADGDATDVGLVAAAQFAPFLVFGLLGGAVADRGDRRAILVASDAARLATQALAGALLLAGAATPAWLAALALVFGAADAFFQPTLVGLVPQTLSRTENIQPANALRGLSYSVGFVAGPAIAGVLIAAIGPGGALLFDAVTFAVSIAFLLALRPAPRPPADAEVEEPRLVAALRGGWRAVRERRWVWSFLLALGIYHVVVLPSVFVLGPVLADQQLGGASSWAVVVAAFGGGSLVGDAILLRWRPRYALRVAAVCLVGASAQAAFIGSGLGTAGIAVLEFFAGIAVNGFFTLWEISLQEHVPDAVLSRVSSYDYVASAGTMPLGFALAGPAADAFGLQPTLFVMAAAGIATAGALLAQRAVRDLPRPTR